MSIHFFTKDNINSPTARFRGYFVVEELKKLGQETIVHTPPTLRPSYSISKKRVKELWKNIKILYSLKSNDTLYLVRTIYQIDFLILVLFFKLIFRKKYIFDFDDPKFLEFPIKMKLMTHFASTVVVGSHFLYDWAKKNNKNVHFLATSIPFKSYSKYTQKYDGDPGQIKIGWIGYAANHLDNLKMIFPVLKKLQSERLNFEFVVIGSSGDKDIHKLFTATKKDNLNIRWIDNIEWTNVEAAPSFIQKFDIGLMPLVANEWNKGKCSLKAIEYMACGVATVCSNVGENKYLIKNKNNGFLVNNTEEWYKILKNLIEDKNLRKKIGQAGQETIKNHYSIEVNAPKIIEILKSV